MSNVVKFPEEKPAKIPTISDNPEIEMHLVMDGVLVMSIEDNKMFLPKNRAYVQAALEYLDDVLDSISDSLTGNLLPHGTSGPEGDECDCKSCTSDLSNEHHAAHNDNGAPLPFEV